MNRREALFSISGLAAGSISIANAQTQRTRGTSVPAIGPVTDMQSIGHETVGSKTARKIHLVFEQDENGRLDLSTTEGSMKEAKEGMFPQHADHVLHMAALSMITPSCRSRPIDWYRRLEPPQTRRGHPN